MIDETFLTTEEVLEYLQVNLRTGVPADQGREDPGGARRASVAVPQAGHRRLARQPAAARRCAASRVAEPAPARPAARHTDRVC